GCRRRHRTWSGRSAPPPPWWWGRGCNRREWPGFRLSSAAFLQWQGQGTQDGEGREARSMRGAKNRRERFSTSRSGGPAGWPPGMAGHNGTGFSLQRRAKRSGQGAVQVVGADQADQAADDGQQGLGRQLLAQQGGKGRGEHA